MSERQRSSYGTYPRSQSSLIIFARFGKPMVGSFTRARMSKFSAIVVVAGLLYQLGACPCGCLEENHWFKVAAELTGAPHEHNDHQDDRDFKSDATSAGRASSICPAVTVCSANLFDAPPPHCEVNAILAPTPCHSTPGLSDLQRLQL